MAKGVVQDSLNPICFSEDSEKYIAVESIEIQQTSHVLTLKETTEISADEP